jgi:hypothetical protein
LFLPGCAGSALFIRVFIRETKDHAGRRGRLRHIARRWKDDGLERPSPVSLYSPPPSE